MRSSLVSIIPSSVMPQSPCCMSHGVMPCLWSSGQILINIDNELWHLTATEILALIVRSWFVKKVFPLEQHRLSRIAGRSQRYDSTLPILLLAAENSSASLALDDMCKDWLATKLAVDASIYLSQQEEWRDSAPIVCELRGIVTSHLAIRFITTIHSIYYSHR